MKKKRNKEWRCSDLMYAARIDTMEVEIPELFRIQHFFRDLDIEAFQMRTA